VKQVVQNAKFSIQVSSPANNLVLCAHSAAFSMSRDVNIVDLLAAVIARITAKLVKSFARNASNTANSSKQEYKSFLELPLIVRQLKTKYCWQYCK